MKRQRKKGFTLTETAIVLGVVGVIIGGIWTAAHYVYNSRKTAQVTGDILLLVSNIKAAYPNGHILGTGGWMTGYLESANLVPGDMVMPCNGSVVWGLGNDNASGQCSFLPWGNRIVISGGGTGSGWFNLQNAPNLFTIFVSYMTTSQCIALMSSLINGGAYNNGLVAVGSDSGVPYAGGPVSYYFNGSETINTFSKCGTGDYALQFKF